MVAAKKDHVRGKLSQQSLKLAVCNVTREYLDDIDSRLLAHDLQYARRGEAEVLEAHESPLAALREEGAQVGELEAAIVASNNAETGGF
jgi:hypothetical protein